MEFDNNVPIYQQITDLLRSKIISEEYAAGAKIKPVRDLAIEMGVNPNTMQKSLAVLELEGLVFTERTSGRYVTRDTQIIEGLRNDMMEKEIKKFLEKMAAMGYDSSKVVDELKKYTSVNEKGLDNK